MVQSPSHLVTNKALVNSQEYDSIVIIFAIFHEEIVVNKTSEHLSFGHKMLWKLLRLNTDW